MADKTEDEINPELSEIKRLLQVLSIFKDNEREKGINIIIKRIDNLISRKVKYLNILSKFVVQIDKEIGEGSSTPDFKEGFIIGWKKAQLQTPTERNKEVADAIDYLINSGHDIPIRNGCKVCNALLELKQKLGLGK